MRPIKLKIKGLNSFIEEQVIDFETLTDRGLFGIFGPTGSGKSTILDGITLALYGDVSRKSSNFINTNCDKLNINFEFQISGLETKRYFIDREFKRKKDTGSPQSGKCKIVDITEEEPKVLADKVTGVNETVKSIIGLSLEDFTRTVVLPQGKFSEFLRLEGKDRRNMLERLFNLQKYGDNLSSKLIREINKVRTNNSILLGQLTGYEDISEEILEERSKTLNDVTEAVLEAKKELDAIEESYKAKKVIWNLQLELDNYKSEEDKLKEKKLEVENKKVKLGLSESANKLIPYVNSYEETLNGLKNCDIDLVKLSEEIEILTSEKNYIELEWKDVLSDKEKRLPTLIINRQKAEDAIEEEKALISIDENISVLETRIKKGEGMNKDGEVKFKSILMEIEEKEKKLKLDEAFYEELKIDEVLKENVQKGLIEVERRSNFKELVEKNIAKIEVIKRNIQIEEKNKLDIENKLKIICKYYESKKKELESLIVPGEQKDLLKLQDDLAKSNETWSTYNRLSQEIKNSGEEIKELEILLQKDRKESNKLEEEVNKLKTSLKDIERENIVQVLRNELFEGECCPVCGSKEHKINDIKVSNTLDIKVLEEEIAIKDLKLKDFNNSITSNETKIRTLDKNIQLREEAIKALGSDFKNITPDSIEKEFNFLKNTIEKYLRDKEILEEEINAYNKEINELNVAMSSNILIIKNYFDQLETINIENKENNQKLKESEDYLKELIAETKVINFEEKNKEIKEVEKKKANLDKVIRFSREGLNELLKKKEEIQILNQRVKDTLNKCYAELDILNKNRKEKIGSIKLKVGEEKDLNLLLESLQREIRKIETNYKSIEEKKQNIEKVYIDKNNMLISIKTKSEELNKRKSIEKKNLDEWINSSEFNSIEEVKLNTLREEDIILLKKNIDTYFEAVNKIKGAIESLLKKIDGKVLSKEAWEEIKKIRDDKKEESRLLMEEKVRVQEEVRNIKIKLKELSNLLEKKKEIDHSLALLGDLEKLFKGKKFVEFVATNQLKYVSIEASKRLKEITNGGYGLEVDDSSKFIIRDYKNGGAERDASTLSGGETFLASLALALALSAQIQLKGTAPLELFFLDEGFGTLDDNLLEVVMSSLEKIHNEKLKVGIISHVESIKNRVPVKLILTPAESGRGGSKVKIERS